MRIGQRGRFELDLAPVVVVVETTENSEKLQKWKIGVYEGVGGSLVVQNRGTTLSPSELASLSFFSLRIGFDGRSPSLI